MERTKGIKKTKKIGVTKGTFREWVTKKTRRLAAEALEATLGIKEIYEALGTEETYRNLKEMKNKCIVPIYCRYFLNITLNKIRWSRKLFFQLL